MKINVHVRDKMFVIHCGPGNQKVSWLAETAINRYDSNYCFEVGALANPPIRVQNGFTVDKNGTIQDVLQDNIHVHVVLQDDEQMKQEQAGNQQRRPGPRR